MFICLMIARLPKIALKTILLVDCLLVITSISNAGQQFQFFLNIRDLFDPTWVYQEYERKMSKVQCATLCYKDETKCFFFAFKDSICHLLDDSVDESSCSQDDCKDDGMLIYKLKEDTNTKEYVCDASNKGLEGELKCPDETYLLKQMGSRSKFFADVLGASCSRIKEQVYEDPGEEFSFFSLDGGYSLNAKCPHENDVIVSFKVCVINMHIPMITVNCHRLLDPDRIEDKFNASSDDTTPHHQLVNCGDGDNVGLQKIYFMDAGDATFTKVIFSCVKLTVEAEDLPVNVDDPGSALPAI